MLFLVLLGAATAMIALVTGFLLAFLLVVMPGLARLDDAGLLRGFQVIDGVIQDGDPRFGLLWIGSVLALIAAAVFGAFVLPVTETALLIAATAIYLVGVQLPTFAKNIPLNNAVQRLKIDEATKEELADARRAFEAPWNRWNVFRTCVGLLTTALLLAVLIRV